jgi:hypothetical protein
MCYVEKSDKGTQDRYCDARSPLLNKTLTGLDRTGRVAKSHSCFEEALICSRQALPIMKAVAATLRVRTVSELEIGRICHKPGNSQIHETYDYGERGKKYSGEYPGYNGPVATEISPFCGVVLPLCD